MRAIRTLLVSAGLLSVVAVPPYAGAIPNGWLQSGSAPKDYEMGSDPSAAHTGKVGGFLRSKTDSASGFGTLMQEFKGERFRGKRVRMSGWVKSEGVKGWAGLWMRVDGPDSHSLALDNMQGRPIQGTSAWTRYEIVLDVAPYAQDIAFGILLNGPGQVWLDDVGFEVVDNSVAVTSRPAPEFAEDPANLDFEK